MKFFIFPVIFFAGVMAIAILTSSCVHRIEERCLEANLKINHLVIEDTINNQSHAKVVCSSKKQ